MGAINTSMFVGSISVSSMLGPPFGKKTCARYSAKILKFSSSEPSLYWDFQLGIFSMLGFWVFQLCWNCAYCSHTYFRCGIEIVKVYIMYVIIPGCCMSSVSTNQIFQGKGSAKRNQNIEKQRSTRLRPDNCRNIKETEGYDLAILPKEYRTTVVRYSFGWIARSLPSVFHETFLSDSRRHFLSSPFSKKRYYTYHRWI